MKRLVLKLMLLMVGVVTVSANRYDVRDYGAKGDGRTLDHGAINAAIEACVAGGGGQVVVPAGTYLCGSIRLKSRVELHLMAGATILAAPASMKAYDESESFGGFPEYQDGGHTYFHNSLIWAEGQHDVSITGLGMIDGEGLTRKDTERAGNVQGGSIGTGDKAIALKLCRNVTIRDITIYRGGHFAIIVTGCKIGTIDNVTIDTNRDGIDIDCCKYFTVSNTKVNTPHDDAIVLKSSYALKRPVLCEHILITNCIVTGYKLGTFLDGTYVPEQVNWVCGRIKLGTESNGGYRNITISNCTCMWSSGLAFEVVDQGRMENIVVSNISMSHVHHYPIYITTGCRNRGPKERTDVSTARDISISQVIADDCDSLAGIIVTGMAGEPIRNVSLSNIRIQYRGGGKKVTTPYREQSTNYPEPRWAGPTPAYGLFARHVDGLRLDHVEFELLRPDERPDIVLEDVKRASAWAQETVDRSLTRHNFLYAGEGKQRRMFIVKDGQVAWRYDNPQGRGEISDAVLMTDGNVLVAHQYGICEVTQDNKTTWKYDAPQGTEIHTIQPIGRDRVLFVQNGHPAKVVVMSIPSCQIAYEFEVPASEGVHGQFRNARLSSRGTLLLANMGLDYVAEYNAEGHELTRWECPAPWSVAELANDRLLFVGRGLVREIDRGSGLGSVVRELKTADYGIKSPQKAVRLENGNTIINDWHNEWRTPIDTLNAPVQAIEIDRAGNVVWQLCAWTNPDLGPSTTIQPLDQAVDRDRLFFGRRNGF